MSTCDDFFLTAKNGTKLAGKEWVPENPKAVICMVHGLGEHIGRYEHVAEFFNENEIAFYGYDLRGHGHSEGKRGHTPSYDLLLNDIEELLMYARAEFNDLPISLYGHSLGGNLVSNYILRNNVNELAGAIISSPWLRLAMEPPSTKIKLARFMNKILPFYSESNQLDEKLLTNDERVNQAYKNDPLVHDKISVRMFTSCYDAGYWALGNTGKNKLPLYLLHGAEDKITSPEASKQFAELIGDKAIYQSLEGIRHEPHNDIKKEEVLETILRWVLNFCPTIEDL